MTDATEKRAKKNVELPRERLAYQGRVKCRGGELGHTYVVVGDDWKVAIAAGQVPAWCGHELDDDEPAERFICAGKESYGFGFSKPGDVISIEIDRSGDEALVMLATAKIVGHYPESVAFDWAALSAAEETEHEADRQAKQRSKIDPVTGYCEALNLAYRGMRTKPRRAAFLARVLVEITRGS